MYENHMKPNSITELIDKWATIGDFANDLGCGYEAARKMRTRNAMAPKYWASFVEVCAERGIKGVTFEWLAANASSASIQEPAE